MARTLEDLLKDTTDQVLAMVERRTLLHCAQIAEDVAIANLENGEATAGSSVAQGIANQIRNLPPRRTA